MITKKHDNGSVNNNHKITKLNKQNDGYKSCCKGSQVLDFTNIKWKNNWILEPKQTEIAMCGGSCSGKKTCVPVEKSSLTILYLAFDDSSGEVVERIQVLPDFIISKCACRFVW